MDIIQAVIANMTIILAIIGALGICCVCGNTGNQRCRRIF